MLQSWNVPVPIIGNWRKRDKY